MLVNIATAKVCSLIAMQLAYKPACRHTYMDMTYDFELLSILGWWSLITLMLSAVRAAA